MRAIVLMNRLKMQNKFLKQRIIEEGPNKSLDAAIKRRNKAIRHLKLLGKYEVRIEDICRRYKIKYNVVTPRNWV